ncbi:hypothetical protein [Mucilaginibacter rubeus]|uniref:Uncharacterized protein n=1 Tax=Mucilaginibacter rubeus TaxID=2027860 RepID=A0A5C1HUE0_9SPHI|nr:hypothetical protein [Mucilaginibacter rubeus]QEM09123.1 hypothetical protein DEO27_003520 [Mucilaginibacter rubeus]
MAARQAAAEGLPYIQFNGSTNAVSFIQAEDVRARKSASTYVHGYGQKPSGKKQDTWKEWEYIPAALSITTRDSYASKTVPIPDETDIRDFVVNEKSVISLWQIWEPLRV